MRGLCKQAEKKRWGKLDTGNKVLLEDKERILLVNRVRELLSGKRKLCPKHRSMNSFEQLDPMGKVRNSSRKVREVETMLPRGSVCQDEETGFILQVAEERFSDILEVSARQQCRWMHSKPQGEQEHRPGPVRTWLQ